MAYDCGEPWAVVEERTPVAREPVALLVARDGSLLLGIRAAADRAGLCVNALAGLSDVQVRAIETARAHGVSVTIEPIEEAPDK